MPRFDGPDVSHYQGAGFPWADLVARHAITFGACKVTEGSAFVDSTWRENRAGMRSAGLTYRGLYHYLSPGVPIEAQLANFGRIAGLEPGEFVMLDIEEAGLTAGMILAGLAGFERTYPGRLVRYQGVHFVNAEAPELQRWPWWLPYYGRQRLPAIKYPVTVWQWAGGAGGVVVPGVGAVDSNEIIDESRLRGVCGLETPEPVPEPPEEDSDVLDGFVRDDTDGTFWARGVDEAGQWACPIEELGVAWELYQEPLEDRPHGSLQAHHRLPHFPTGEGPGDLDAIANAVADKLAARLVT